MAATKNTKAFYHSYIPRDWDVSTLGEMTTLLTNGFVGKAKDHYVESEDGVLYIQGYNISESGFNYNGIKKVSKEFHEKNAKSCLQEGDLLTIQTGEIGLTSVVPRELVGANCHALVISRLKQDIAYPNFYLQYFNSEIGKRKFKTIETGSTMRHLNVGDMDSLEFPLPPLPEQKAIAQVLSTADAAIHTTEKLIAQKELRKKWLMQQLLTGKKRLKGFEGEWEKERLEKYLVKHDEKTTTNNQYPVLTSSRKGIFLQSNYYTRDVASEDNTGYNVVPRGFFTYRHMSDDLVFKFNINDIVDKGIVSTLYPVFTTKGINDYFLLAKLNEGNEFKMHAGEQKQGGSRTYVYFNTLCQLKLNMPSIEEQTAIAQVLQAADKEIGLLKAKAERLRELKKGLMQVLLTGKKRMIF